MTLARPFSLFPAAFRLFLRWEVWALVGAAIVGRLASPWLWPLFKGAGPTILGTYSYFGLLMTALSCGILAASMVLLLPLSRGERGLEIRFLSSHMSTALAGAGIAMGTLLPLGFLSTRAVSIGPGWWATWEPRIQWVVADFSVLLCAWYVHGRSAEERGLRPPGPWASARAGLVTAVLALSIPGAALRTFLEAVNPWSRQGMEYALLTLAYVIAFAAIPLLFTAWFYGSLDDEERAHPSP